MIDADAGELYAAWRGAEARIEAAQLIFDQDWDGPNRATAIAMYNALTGATDE